MSTTVTTTRVNTNRLPPLSGQNELRPLPIYDLTQLQDERSQTLKKLLQKGHVTVAPLREPNLLLHSHLPHVSREKLENPTEFGLVLMTGNSSSALHTHWVRKVNS